MAQAPPTLPADLIARIEEGAIEGHAYAKATMTPEQKVATEEWLAKFNADEEFKANYMGKVVTSFAAHDGDSDGMLTKEEYTAWMDGFKADAAAQGTFMDLRE